MDQRNNSVICDIYKGIKYLSQHCQLKIYVDILYYIILDRYPQ